MSLAFLSSRIGEQLHLHRDTDRPGTSKRWVSAGFNSHSEAPMDTLGSNQEKTKWILLIGQYGKLVTQWNLLITEGNLPVTGGFPSQSKVGSVSMSDCYDIDGLVQERRNSIVLAMELCLSCTNPLICYETMASVVYISNLELTKDSP